MALRHLEPKAPVEGASPAVLADAESSISLQVLGWELGHPSGRDASDQWVVVRLEVRNRGREWAAQAAPFGAGALSVLARWLTALAKGEKARPLGYDDPELEFDGSASDDGYRTLRVTLRTFYLPDDLDQDGDGHFALSFRVLPRQLLDFASQLQDQADLLDDSADAPSART